MSERFARLRTSWSQLAPIDWRFLSCVITAAAIIGPATVYFPMWRDDILVATVGLMVTLLGIERARGRRQLARLATQIKAIASLEKIEIPDHPATRVVGQALNEAIQHTREQARIVKLSHQPIPQGEALRLIDVGDEAPRSVAVLALGLREQEQMRISPAVTEHLRDIAGAVVEVAERRAALLQMQGSGVFALIFAAFSQEPAARSAKAAFEAAVELMQAHPDLHFGLSVGTGLPCTLPGAGYTVIGAPLEDAIRLHHLAATWHEYRLLCPEPVALLLRPRAAGQRTPLELTAPNTPPLPVYALELEPEAAVAIGA